MTASTACASSDALETVRAARPRERRCSVSTRVRRDELSRPSRTETGATRRDRPVTAAIPPSNSQGSWNPPSSQSESTPAASRARASARYSPASSNWRGSHTPIFSMGARPHRRGALRLGSEDHNHPERESPEEDQAAGEDREASGVGGPRQEQGHQGAGEHHRPQGEPAEFEEASTHRAEADEEEDQEDQL